MEHLSARVKGMSLSATMAVNQRSRELKARGVDVINLSVGEPDFFTPDHIKNAAKQAIDDNITFYPPAQGFPELVKAVVEKFKRENELDYDPSQVVVSCGAKNSLANTILALIEKGDEVIVPAPYWVTYVELVKMAEGINIEIPSSIETNFKVTAKQIEEKITSKTKAILLCSPSNPSGAIYNEEELGEIVKVVEKYKHVYIISDEIYEHINFVGKHVSPANYPSIKDRVIVINGVSKAYAMTGWRIGYMAGPSWIAKACIKLQGQLITGPSTISQQASIAALNGDQSCVKEMLTAFKRRRDLVVDLTSKMEGVKTYTPSGAFYVFPDVSSFFGKSYGGTRINSANDLGLYLLEKAHIAVVPGEAFGNPDCIRISFANSDENLIEAMNRMKSALQDLK
ncbi:MAG: pyridoxal phosphate-dependent aminotransferase [Bacteroidota bacterium]